MKNIPPIKYTIHPVFPKPVYKTFLKKGLSKKDLDFAIKIKDIRRNEGNASSSNTYILNEKHFNKLKKELNEIVLDYVDKIFCPKYKVEPYITQSWLNYTKTNEYHHQHTHTNSFISGVLYFLADPNLDNITFCNEKYQAISIKPKSYNLFNSTTWNFPVEKNQVILFPSDLIHKVSTKKGNNLRLSLSFNVFLKGRLGDSSELTELILI